MLVDLAAVMQGCCFFFFFFIVIIKKEKNLDSIEETARNVVIVSMIKSIYCNNCHHTRQEPTQVPTTDQ